MENKRPTLSDPQEFALIKQIYFKETTIFNDDIDSLERLERQEAKQRNNNKSSR